MKDIRIEKLANNLLTYSVDIKEGENILIEVLGEEAIPLAKELIKQVDKKTGKSAGYSEKLITFVKDRPGHDKRYAIDATKLNEDLGWKPSVTFEEGLGKTIDWFLENKEWLGNVTSGNYQDYYKKQYN